MSRLCACFCVCIFSTLGAAAVVVICFCCHYLFSVSVIGHVSVCRDYLPGMDSGHVAAAGPFSGTSDLLFVLMYVDVAAQKRS